ncbi:NAD+ synthase [bacterium]|nr:NAD+ synthase [bacterium]
MRVAIAQLNPIVGDVKGNIAKLRNSLNLIKPGDADLIVFPELYLCGYPPRDLLNLPWFIERLENGLKEVIRISASRTDIGILMGTVRCNDREMGRGLFNSALLIEAGKLLFETHKRLLPSYDVFDESHYFDTGEESNIFSYRGEKFGISIFEDAWNDPQFEKHVNYDRNPIEDLAKAGASLLINISASPYHLKKEYERFERYSHHSQHWSIPLIYVAQVGANDDLIFDGRSMLIDKKGRLVTRFAAYEEEIRIVDTGQEGSREDYSDMPEMESLRRALVLGISDYVTKSGLGTAIVGLSGGIDSAVTCCLAVDALGNENVRTLTMPSQYSSEGSIRDSIKLAENLSIKCDIIPITDLFKQYLTSLKEPFNGLSPDLTEENIQARIRGNLLMAYSNKFGGLVLTAGNKSEAAVGYCTLYGDMCGGLAPIGDLPKGMVYQLAEWYNRERELIPKVVLSKAPSAELRPDQKDQDTLPPYDVLDGILEMYLENRRSRGEIVDAGFDLKTVEWVIQAVDRSEHKRRQAAPGLRVTSRTFGTGWRLPIASRRT